jgi:SAM-dependent methyltransferase
MHPVVFELFERICAEARIEGEVLEVGAVPAESLLRLPSLSRCTRRVGLNLEAFADAGGLEMLVGDARAMSAFADGRFAAVLCNSVLEHDRQFWKSVVEIHRVTAPGGLVVIGVPSFGAMGLPEQMGWPYPLPQLLRRLPAGPARDALAASTPTLGLHQFPEDYYRFSDAAVREVFMEGLQDVTLHHLLCPPRTIAAGRKPS